MNIQGESTETMQENISGIKIQGASPQAPKGYGGAIAPEAPGSNGQQTPPKERRNVRRLMLPVIVIILLAGALITLRYWYDDAFYVSTDNAKISGAMIQVGALNAGRVEAIGFDVGARVEKDQVVATVALPSVVSVAQGASKIGFLSTDELRTEVRSPIGGVVVARQANVGDTIAAGQGILTIVDPTAQWVAANIEETKMGRIKVGQSVDVHVDALEQTFQGHIQTITPATAATFSLLPQQNGSGNFTKVTQLVPVKITVDSQGQTLPLGGSVEVRIKVAEPVGWLSWLP